MKRGVLMLYHFLGGIYFAIILLTLVAVVAIGGTFLESSSGSHGYAAQFTYGHPLFYVLVSCFFINILFSALRRWPFQPRHIPFLITHLGLLMILSGMIAKSLFGLQGTMTIVEGTGSHQVRVADRVGLRLESRLTAPQEWQLLHSLLGHPYLQALDSAPHEVAALLTQHTPHASEKLELWTKGNHAFVEGLPPIPLTTIEVSPEPYQIGNSPYNFQALATEDVPTLIEQLYRSNVDILVHDNITNELLYQDSLERVLQGPIYFHGTAANLSLALDESPRLLVNLAMSFKRGAEEVEIPLSGKHALMNLNLSSALRGSLPFTITLQRKPLIALIRSTNGDETMVALGPHGDIYQERFQSDKLESVYVLDDGYGGYAIQCTIPDQSDTLHGRRWECLRQLGSQHLGYDQPRKNPLPRPFALLAQACESLGQKDVFFPMVCLEFLDAWDRSYSWLLDADAPLSPEVTRAIDAIDWSQISKEERQGCMIVGAMAQDWANVVHRGDDLCHYLRTSGWPGDLPSEIDADPYAVLDMVQRHLFLAAAQVPENICMEMAGSVPGVTLFSAYCRAYGLHLSQIPNDFIMGGGKELYLRSPVSVQHTALPPLKELEKNRPAITAMLRRGNAREEIALSLDTSGVGLKWPVLGGKFLARFQALLQDIPYHVRLRDARKISYPNTQQPFSYEADVIITDLRSDEIIETTLSMNRVHETSDGYRFYLAGMAPADETAARQVQLAVNRDPAKYALTYLGAMVMTLGIILLGLRTPFNHARKE